MRAQEKDGLLRGCPTCGTKVDAAQLGLRDYRWVNDYLPGKVGGMDLDFAITQRASGRALFLEFKPSETAPISTGARLTFELLRSHGFDVWVARERPDGQVRTQVLGPNGKPVSDGLVTSRESLGRRVGRWWERGL